MDIKAIIKSLVVKTLLRLSGLRAWVASMFFNYIWKHVMRAIKMIRNKRQVNKEVNEQLKKYKEVINDPDASADDIKNAGSDLLNG